MVKWTLGDSNPLGEVTDNGSFMKDAWESCLSNMPTQGDNQISLNTRAKLFRVRDNIQVAITSPWKMKDQDMKILSEGSESHRTI